LYLLKCSWIDYLRTGYRDSSINESHEYLYCSLAFLNASLRSFFLVLGNCLAAWYSSELRTN
ncbi:MAG: hypothetical protein ACRDEA_06970, partial [Microcystaceae cyanobacterium]